MRASTKRILSILLSGIFLISLIFVATTLIRPEFENAMKKRAKLFAKENLFENQKNAVAQVQQLIQEFQEFSQLQETVSLAVPLSVETTQLLNQLEAIATASGVEIRTFETLPQEAFEPSSQPLVRRLGSMKINMVVDGPYEGIKNFMKFLETNVRIFNIQNMVAVSKQNGEFIELTLTVETYFQE